jgi:hypothetical protein
MNSGYLDSRTPDEKLLASLDCMFLLIVLLALYGAFIKGTVLTRFGGAVEILPRSDRS